MPSGLPFRYHHIKPGFTSGTDAATFARPGDEKIVAALGVSSARKPGIAGIPVIALATLISRWCGVRYSRFAALHRTTHPRGGVVEFRICDGRRKRR